MYGKHVKRESQDEANTLIPINVTKRGKFLEMEGHLIKS
jgi:hypothetical protein